MPEFLTEIGKEVLVPCMMLPKSRLVGVKVTAGAGFRPVPLSWADSVGGAALSVIVKAALRLPGAVGVNEIRTEHDWPGGNEVGSWHPSIVMAKSPHSLPLLRCC